MKKLFVIGFAALLLLAFTAPVMAKVDIHGIVFTDFYYYKVDQENTIINPSGDDFSATYIQVPDITRINVIWTNEHGVGMRFETGHGDEDSDNTAHVGLRHAYGWWDATPNFQLMAGHSTTPFSPLNPNQLMGLRSPGIHIIGIGYGEFYSGRFSQVRGTYKFGKMGDIAVALCDPTVATNPLGLAPQAGKAVANDSKLPRIDVGVKLVFGPVTLYPGVMYQKQTYDNAASGQDDDVTTWAVSLGLKGGFGPVAVEAEVNYGQNMGNVRGSYGILSPPSLVDSAVLTAGGKVENADCLGYWIDLSVKAGMATPHFIYGSYKVKNNLPTGVDTDAKATMYGIHVVIPVAQTYMIRPEVMIYDNGDNNDIFGVKSVDYGKETLAGVVFMVVF